MTNRQTWTAAALTAAGFGALVVPAAIVWSELPASIATHWDLGGTPNGHMPPAALLLGLLALFLALATGVWSASRRMPFEARSFLAGMAGIGGLLAAVQWVSLDANRGVADWTDATGFTAIHLVAILTTALIAGALGWWAAGPSAPGVEKSARQPGPAMAIPAGTHPVWASGARGTTFIVIALILLGAAVVVWSVVSLMLVAIALVVLVFAEVRVTVSERGVVLSLGWLGIPHRLVPMGEVAGATVEDVSPMAYGGWGYRVRPGTRALVVRGGSALRLLRPDRPDLVVTVDDAERGAALVNGLIAAR